jgi:hypothetical protein
MKHTGETIEKVNNEWIIERQDNFKPANICVMGILEMSGRVPVKLPQVMTDSF